MPTTKRQLIKLLKTEPEIHCLNLKAYIGVLAVAIEYQMAHPDAKLAKIIKPKGDN